MAKFAESGANIGYASKIAVKGKDLLLYIDALTDPL